MIVATGTVVIALVLLFESELALAATLALAAVLWWGGQRQGVLGKAGAFADHRPRIARAIFAGAAAVLLLLFHSEHYALLMVATVLLFAAACAGINIQTGFAGIANFAGAAFFACGGYTMAVLTQHTGVPHVLAILVAGAVTAGIGAVLLLPVLRTRGYYSALVTIAFGILCSSFLQVNEHLGGAQGLQLGPLHILGWDMGSGFEIAGREVSFYFAYALLALVVFMLASLLAHAVEWSAIGVSFDAVRNDELVSSSFGIDLQRWKVTAFLLGNFLIGIAGAVYAGLTSFVSPSGATFEQSLLLISIVILGGIGNTWGALLAAALVVLVPEKLQSLQEYRILIFSVSVVAVLLFRPKGLVPRRMRDFSVTGGVQ
ncbi:branched-chain amino acid ABC transporter permease [Corticibacter populi]|uniref:branched-chain amino acid ABC transporter permease n=1 Tax=Corticibacter populi TaxID=1550736 RepID=UPI001F5EAEAA|nr:branched-chain amino acid ABC transporter permease [Corticibacter populi]